MVNFFKFISILVLLSVPARGDDISPWTVEVLRVGSTEPDATASGVSGNTIIGNSNQTTAGYVWHYNSSTNEWEGTSSSQSNPRLFAIEDGRIGGALGNSARVWGYLAGSSFPGSSTQLPVDSNFLGSSVRSIGGNILVGIDGNEAVEWTFDDSTNLFSSRFLPIPSGFFYAQGLGTDGVHNVGFIAESTEFPSMAALWEVQSSSFISLHPSNAENSVALDVDAGQKVGSITILTANETEIHQQAVMWDASNNMTVLSTSTDDGVARATAVHNGIQVGFTDEPTQFYEYAFLWNSAGPGSPSLPTNLHEILEKEFPGRFIASQANGIYVVEGLITVVGSARESQGSASRPIVWTRGISVDCIADINDDGVLNFFDVSAFMALWSAQDPAADLFPISGGDGVWNFFDISQYITYFTSGCPTN